MRVQRYVNQIWHDIAPRILKSIEGSSHYAVNSATQYLTILVQQMTDVKGVSADRIEKKIFISNIQIVWGLGGAYYNW